MRGTHHHCHPRPRMGGWSTWLHSCSTGDNHMTCSHPMAREAGKGHAGGQPRPGVIPFLRETKNGFRGAAPGLCRTRQHAHMAVTSKWAHRTLVFSLCRDLDFSEVFVLPSGRLRNNRCGYKPGFCSQAVCLHISLTNWVTLGRWLPLHDPPFSSTVSRETWYHPPPGKP